MPLSVIVLYILGALPTLGLSLVALVIHWLALAISGKRHE